MDRRERQIPLRRMYATSLLLFLPRDLRGWLLDARREMPRRFFLQRRNDLRARGILGGMMAARMKHASRGWVRRRRHISLQKDSILARLRIRDRHRREKRLGVGH